MTVAYGPLLDALRGVRWPVRRAVGAALPGAHRSRQRGTAGEFTEYRLYRQGDDPKQLDWKLLARSDRAFVRLTDDRALLPTWLIVDASASMAFPDPRHSTPGVPDKWSYARAVAVGLGAVAHASSDPIGVLCTDRDGERRLSPRTRRGTVNEVMLTLDGATPGGVGSLAPLLGPISPNARIVIVSDMLGDLDELLRVVAQLVAAGAMAHAVHVVAAEELNPQAAARLAQDPESAIVERVMDRDSLPAYTRAFAAFREETARRWRATGAGYTEAHTDAPLARLIRQIVGGVR